MEKGCSRSEILNTVFSSSPQDWHYDHSGIFTYNKNVLLQIRKDKSEESSRFYEPWTKNFPNSEASSKNFSVYYVCNKIADFHFVSADGGNVYIPCPKSSVELKISKNQYNLAKIINSLMFSRPKNLDDALSKAGISCDVTDGADDI